MLDAIGDERVGKSKRKEKERKIEKQKKSNTEWRELAPHGK